MSRSFKHTPVYKGDKDRSAKKYANRRVRRNGKIKHEDLKAGKSKHYKKLNESWHICDYRTWGEPIWRRESCKNLSDWPESRLDLKLDRRKHIGFEFVLPRIVRRTEIAALDG